MAASVFVFFNANTSPGNVATGYCNCVSTSPAVSGGCHVSCRVIDISQVPPDPIAQQFASGSSIEVVAVKDNQVVGRLNNPTSCDPIHNLVAQLCS